MDRTGRVDNPQATFDDETAAALVAAASDITLLVTQEGVIENASGDSQIWESVPFQSWVGKKWVDTVSSESRVKVDEMLRDVRSGEAVTRWRHINHRGHEGQDIPVLFSLVKTGKPNQYIAIGRDLRSVAELQARLLEAQQFMERDYLRLRRLENQYRLLFDLVNEPVLVLRLDRLQVLESNRAAGLFFGQEPEQLVGKTFEGLMTQQSLGNFQQALRQVDTSGRSTETTLRFFGKESAHTVSVFHLKR
ncbi:MAG: PAS domain-containing protein, partial [Burkholderiaceae bacterium]